MKFLTAAAGLALLAIASSSSAATINLSIGGLDIMYDGPAKLIRDLNSLGTPAGGNQVAAEANPLVSSTFEFGDMVVEQFMASDAIFGDLLVKNLPSDIAAPTPFTLVEGNNDLSFGFDWFLQEGGATVSSLQLEFDSVNVALFDTGADDPVISINASTTKWSAFNLPGGLAFVPGARLNFSYTTADTAAAPTNANEYTVVFGMKGVANITGEAIPEPAAGYFLLAGLGAVAVATRWRLG